eukprot:179769_1
MAAGKNQRGGRPPDPAYGRLILRWQLLLLILLGEMHDVHARIVNGPEIHKPGPPQVKNKKKAAQPPDIDAPALLKAVDNAVEGLLPPGSINKAPLDPNLKAVKNTDRTRPFEVAAVVCPTVEFASTGTNIGDCGRSGTSGVEFDYSNAAEGTGEPWCDRTDPPYTFMSPLGDLLGAYYAQGPHVWDDDWTITINAGTCPVIVFLAFESEKTGDRDSPRNCGFLEAGKLADWTKTAYAYTVDLSA